MTNGLRSVADLDETDLAILERVEADFDVSLETLAVELDISKSAVHYRINKLKESGVIRGVTADVDPRSLGLEMVAITDVSVTHETGYSDEIGAELDALVGVEQVYYTMGDIDFVVISRVQSREQLNALIDRMVAIDGVNETSSKFVMQEFENDRRYVSNLSEEARAAVLNPSSDADG
ncbi:MULTISPECIES: Lrp/AsnC family transcriptional regulator [unclassified Haloferax]|uniref:Lrp/AsnC family transcriptional regulator n=1 Tax=Haloferax sp. Atlit-48N TaxID=2077198 RepID=A0ACD5I1N2_9EURY|nr:MULTISPECIES: Lrp/AsnC family transcriptional regulator [unclassified Haloferax]RDZ30310.1 Lrp/AsnC family transcriptional regulator [Haloferax sp. Atlit-48N]RDZ34072.1 Lrp/AsnC family transcriptional regulator [Haloferax sp. Atlit-24N]RLM33677.1 Lrp/AsnC family transcriptional regulator [Haloferax sp. Atlit-109R]RLM40742.1 Lrp/AsnC family transcriptional regulator [Haloferax sp. Atlit-105R]